MVGINTTSNKLDEASIAFAGAASGFITRGLCQPLDVLKIRFQLQVEPISKVSVSKYRSLVQAVVTICREEGFKSLWKGHVPAQFLSVSYGLVQFWTYEILTKKIVDKKSYNFLSDFYSGALAGSLATLVSFPFDVVRTRLVAQSEHHKIYKGICNSFYNIIVNEGYLALYKGLLPTILQVAPHTGVQFMSFKLFESVFHKSMNCSIESRKDVFTSGILCGSFAGLCAKVAVYPFDLSRKRMQIQGFDRKAFGKNFICGGFIDCIRRIYEYEGILGFYKGLSPSLIKAVTATALHFTTYDLICYEIANYKNN